MAGGLNSSYTTIERILPTNFSGSLFFLILGGWGACIRYQLQSVKRCRSRIHGGALACSAPGCFDGLAVPVAGQSTPYISPLGTIAARPAPAVQWKIYPLTNKLTIERRGAQFQKKFIRKSCGAGNSKRPAPLPYAVHVRPTVHPRTVPRLALARRGCRLLTLCVAARGRGGRSVAAVQVPAFVFAVK